jgi:uncharacterized protein (DUF885 family)
VIETDLNPAIRRYRDFLHREYLPSAREALGVSANTNGADCYRATIRSFATVEMEPDSVFEMGLREMTRIEGEMRTIAARSFAGESVSTLMHRLQTDPRYTFRTSQEIIDTSLAIMARAKAAMGQWFGRTPKADVIIQPYPEFRQKAGAPGQYQSAPDDGSRPAIFLINPSIPRSSHGQMRRIPRCTKGFPATTCRSPSPRNGPTCIACCAIGSTAASARGGRCTRNG